MLIYQIYSKANRCVDLHEFCDLHTAGKRKFISVSIGLLSAHFFNLSQLAFPLSLFPGLPKSRLFNGLRSWLGTVVPWVIKLLVAAIAEVVTFMLVQAFCCQLVAAAAHLALDASLVESFSVRRVHPVSRVDRFVTGRASLNSSPLRHFLGFSCRSESSN